MTTCFLRVGSDSLDEAYRCPTIRDALDDFRAIAEELARFEQPIEGSVHIAPHQDDVVEYPDLVLSLGPRGGLRVERV